MKLEYEMGVAVYNAGYIEKIKKKRRRNHIESEENKIKRSNVKRQKERTFLLYRVAKNTPTGKETGSAQ